MDHLHELAAVTSQFADLARAGDGSEEVPACAGWTLRHLTEHLGGVHRWAAAIVLSGQRLPMPAPVITEPVGDWYAATAAALLAALRCVDPREQVPNFSRLDETAAFWRRRQMHEVIVHTVDAAQSLGMDESLWTVDPLIAADGVDEVLQIFFPRLTAGGRRPDVRAAIRLHATDIDQSWIVAPGRDATAAPVQIHASREAAATVSGTATDLYLGLWGRVDVDRLTFEGAEAKALFAGATTP